jgi:DnaJ-class molecular chaperone
MAEDPYSVLGVGRGATVDEIRKAYRAAAKKSHPDLHPGDAGAEARFKALNAANDLLSDAEKRAAFDRGEIDAEGQPVMPERPFYRDYAQAQPAGGRYGGGAGFEEDDLHDMFGAFFRNQAGAGGQTGPRRGRDRSYRLDVPFLDTVNGATERLTLPDGQSLDVRIPPGLTDGQVLRLRGKGEPGLRGGEAGDALIEVSVFPHPLYKREGSDLEMELPVTFAEAIRGARVEVPTPRGKVTLAVPARADAGTRLRLRGRGVAAHRSASGEVAAGDLYVVLRIVVGPVDEALETFLAGWKPPAGADVRAGLEDAA